MPRPATLWVPDFLKCDDEELYQLLHCLRFPLATHVYLLVRAHSDFKSGHYLGGYDRLIELSTEPQPERGRRVPAPTLSHLRRAIGALVKVELLMRGDQNEAQGQLRLWHYLPIPKDAARRIGDRVNDRVWKRANPIPKPHAKA